MPQSLPPLMRTTAYAGLHPFCQSVTRGPPAAPGRGHGAAPAPVTAALALRQFTPGSLGLSVMPAGRPGSSRAARRAGRGQARPGHDSKFNPNECHGVQGRASGFSRSASPSKWQHSSFN
eukprot:767665-Hanusia_phi.AAC.3